MELDPIQFLAQEDSDDDSENDDDEQIGAVSKNNGNDPSILTSLGLQHVNSATPYASLAVSFEIDCAVDSFLNLKFIIFFSLLEL